MQQGDLHGQRPVTATCAHCGRIFKVNPQGRPASFCKPSCRVMVFDKSMATPTCPWRTGSWVAFGKRWLMAVVAGKLPPKLQQEGKR
jgi:hypothetical protein